MKNSINKKIKEYFESEETFSKETLEFITWYIYQLENNRYHDLYLLAKILPEKYIAALVSYFDGDVLKLPTKEKYRELRLVAVCFFLKKIQRWDWTKIKDFLSISDDDGDIFSSISIGNKINRIMENLNSEINEVIKSGKNVSDTDEMEKILKAYIGN